MPAPTMILPCQRRHRGVHRDRLQPPKAPLGSCLPVARGVQIQPAPGCCAAARGYDAAELSVICCLTKGVHLNLYLTV